MSATILFYGLACCFVAPATQGSATSVVAPPAVTISAPGLPHSGSATTVTAPAVMPHAVARPILPNAAPARPAGPQLLPIEENVIRLTNYERARHGLPPLQVDPALMASARRHAAWMTNSRQLQHTRAPVAENIAMGQPNSSEALRSWMNSSGHRANILRRMHTRIGVGVYRTASGTIYWCQQFLH